MMFLVLLLVVVPMCSAEVLLESSLGLDEFLRLLDEGVGQIRDKRSPVQPDQNTAHHINYRPYSQLPNQIKELLQFQQAREPITHIPAQPPPSLAHTQSAAQTEYKTRQQISQYKPQVQYSSLPQQAPQHQPQPQPAPVQYSAQYQPQQQLQSQRQYQAAPQQAQYPQPTQPAQPQYYRPIPHQGQVQSAPQPQYSNQQPPQLLQVQSHIPNSIPPGYQQGGAQTKAFRPEQRPLY